MIQAFLMAFLTYWNLLSVEHIIFLAFLLGVINAFDMPLRQTFLSDIVTRQEDLPNAIAMNSSMVNTTRLIGPALAGLVIGLGGEAVCFLLNGISYLAVLGALAKMKIKHSKRPGKYPGILSSLREGLDYCFGVAPIRYILLLLSLTSITSVSLSTLLPVFATKLFTEGSSGLGILSAISGGGALAGAIFLASRRSVFGLGRIIAIATSVLGVGMLLFAYSPFEKFSIVCLFMTGAGNIVQMVASNSLLQVIAEEDKRGRVLSFYIVSLLGLAPLGSLLAGFLGSHIGAPATIGLTGIATILSAALFASQLPKMELAALGNGSGKKPEGPAGVSDTQYQEEKVE
jgi:MFS family permease